MLEEQKVLNIDDTTGRVKEEIIDPFRVSLFSEHCDLLMSKNLDGTITMLTYCEE